ncbi:fatty-acid amide hydrolase 2-B-like [Chironomus tepperi]|uniref:fatty-acid amide hydrolase 2-B-like n=1 Tax=Chironomus tepperi TaxID=113505 RepID=UPI00391F50BF
MASALILTILNTIHQIIVFIGRYVYKNFVYGDRGAKVPPINNPLLLESATSLAKKIRRQEVTSVEVMTAFIERAKEINPIINCVVDERYSDALKEAEEVDKFIASGVMSEEEMEQKKPFLGVPISTKDSIQVKGMINTAGCVHRKNVVADKDAPVVANMKKAGAIFYCLTNVPELCMWFESNNEIFGRTSNPYDTFRICGGSSGGEGAIQAAAGSPFGIGSDIGGSIRMPAFFNGIFGHKTSRSIVSNEGQHPSVHNAEEEHMLGIGPMCRYACDLKPMLKLLAREEKVALLKLDEPVDIRKIKVYYQENDLGGNFVTPVDKDIQIALMKVVEYFKNDLNLEVTRTNISRTKNNIPMWLANMACKGSVPLAQQISPNPNQKINVYLELVKKIFGKSNHTLAVLLTALKAEFGVQPDTPEHKYLQEERDKTIKDFQDILKDDGIFLYPSHATVATYHTETLLRPLNFTYTSLINLLGMPSCNIPLGLGREGVPVGIQVVSNYNNDRLCLAVACELEKAFGGWVNPNP